MTSQVVSEPKVRRSTRFRVLPARLAPIPDPHLELSPRKPSPRKRRRVAKYKDASPSDKDDETAQTRGIRAAASPSFPGMPLEIVLEIVSWVDPPALLNLSRTSKYLRRILMRPQAKLIWKASLSRVEGLPPCPGDLTEPQYTRLVFDLRCHHCRKQGKHSVIWVARMRSCDACASKRMKGSLPDLLWPESQEWENDPTFIPWPVELRQKFGINNSTWRETRMFWDTLKEQYRSEFRLLIGRQRKDAWLAKRRAQIAALKQHALVLEKWQAAMDKAAQLS